jgi:hypothetical protein
LISSIPHFRRGTLARVCNSIASCSWIFLPCRMLKHYYKR